MAVFPLNLAVFPLNSPRPFSDFDAYLEADFDAVVRELVQEFARGRKRANTAGGNCAASSGGGGDLSSDGSRHLRAPRPINDGSGTSMRAVGGCDGAIFAARDTGGGDRVGSGAAGGAARPSWGAVGRGHLMFHTPYTVSRETLSHKSYTLNPEP